MKPEGIFGAVALASIVSFAAYRDFSVHTKDALRKEQNGCVGYYQRGTDHEYSRLDVGQFSHAFTVHNSKLKITYWDDPIDGMVD